MNVTARKFTFNLFLSDLLLVDAVLLVDAQDLGLLHVGEDTVDQAPVLHVKLMFALLCSFFLFLLLEFVQYTEHNSNTFYSFITYLAV